MIGNISYDYFIFTRNIINATHPRALLPPYYCDLGLAKFYGPTPF